MRKNTDNDTENNKKKQRYGEYVKAHAKRSDLLKDCVFAYFSGGAICALGQLLYKFYISLGAENSDAGTLVSVTLIFISVLLTGLGVFDKIAKHAGAGTLVPITGFANAVASPAIDAKAEGWVCGTGVKIFTVAGPVILYGTLSSVIYGLIYYTVKAVLE